MPKLDGTPLTCYLHDVLSLVEELFEERVQYKNLMENVMEDVLDVGCSPPTATFCCGGYIYRETKEYFEQLVRETMIAREKR